MQRLVDAIRRFHAWLECHESTLWWVHSLWALALGVAVMWLGASNFLWLRLAAIHVVVIWSASMLLANFVDRPDHQSVWWHRLRLVINYVTKNFYQQILFFILPIYAGSATIGSGNVGFIVLVGVSALLSTLDIFYDRYLTRRRTLNALFFAFNLFAALAVALPILASVSNAWALRTASVAAVLGYVTIALRPSELARRRALVTSAAGALVLAGVIQVAMPFVPPAPLRLTDSQFSTGFDRRRFEAVGAIGVIPEGWTGRLYAVTSLHAPLGLEDAVELRWFKGGRPLWKSSSHDFVGGRREGFRLWSSVLISSSDPPGPVRLDVVTGAGQLVGRATLPVESR